MEIKPGSESGEDNTDNTGLQTEKSSGQEGISSIPGFEMIYWIVSLLAIHMYKGFRK